jgi:hypothetical protein
VTNTEYRTFICLLGLNCSVHPSSLNYSLLYLISFASFRYLIAGQDRLIRPRNKFENLLHRNCNSSGKENMWMWWSASLTHSSQLSTVFSLTRVLCRVNSLVWFHKSSVTRLFTLIQWRNILLHGSFAYHLKSICWRKWNSGKWRHLVIVLNQDRPSFWTKNSNNSSSELHSFYKQKLGITNSLKRGDWQ